MTSKHSEQLKFGRIAACLPVKDIEKSHRLYNAMFGFDKVFENGTPPGFMILQKDDAELHLTLQPMHKAPFNIAHMLVSDATAVYALCEKHGLRIVKRLQDKDYGLRSFVFEDLDGNRIDVGQTL